jgi:hypothetical protein
MISFWISVVPPKLDWTRLSRRSSQSCQGAADWWFPPVKSGSIWSARAAAFARCDLGGDHAPWDRLAAWQLPEPRRGPDDDAEPAAADVPAVDADVEPGKLIAVPQVLVMNDASDGSQMRSCSRELSRGNQALSRGKNAHHNTMSTAALDDHCGEGRGRLRRAWCRLAWRTHRCTPTGSPATRRPSAWRKAWAGVRAPGRP